MQDPIKDAQDAWVKLNGMLPPNQPELKQLIEIVMTALSEAHDAKAAAATAAEKKLEEREKEYAELKEDSIKVQSQLKSVWTGNPPLEHIITSSISLY